MNAQFARAAERNHVDWGVRVVACGGERESGDHYLVQPVENGAWIAVADGMGHGADAARAARLAIDTIQSALTNPGGGGLDVPALIGRCHDALRNTRGVVMGVARFDAGAERLTWFGAGNVAGVLVRRGAAPRIESLLVRAGVIGYRVPALNPSVMKIDRGDVLVVATDGIDRGFAGELSPVFLAEARPERIARWISRRHSKPSDDGLVLVARYTGG